MNKQDKIGKTWWAPPWAWKESVAAVAGLLLTGILLQATTGGFSYDLLRFPVNLVLLTGIITLVVALSFRHKSAFFQWLSGIPLSVSNMGALLFLALVLGIVPQAASPQNGKLPLGIDSVTHSWPFVLVYLFTIVNLGCVLARRLIRFSWKDYAFYLNHLGLLLLLVAAGFGASDMHRYVMHVAEGSTEWRVYNDEGEILELPVAIRLNDFNLEEYLPKLAVVDNRTGETLPQGNPQLWPIDTLNPSFVLHGHSIRLARYLNDAVRTADSSWQSVLMPAACPAALIKSGNRTGWISCGNFAHRDMTFQLNGTQSLVMLRPEPKLFRSDIVVFTENGDCIPYQLEVNKPLRAGNWMIYQYSYDAEKGKASEYSSFELVYDPWLGAVYAGIVLFFAGSVCLLWEGNKKGKRKENDHLG